MPRGGDVGSGGEEGGFRGYLQLLLLLLLLLVVMMTVVVVLLLLLLLMLMVLVLVLLHHVVVSSSVGNVREDHVFSCCHVKEGLRLFRVVMEGMGGSWGGGKGRE